MTLRRVTPFALGVLAIVLSIWTWWKPAKDYDKQLSEKAPAILINSFKQIQFDNSGLKVAELSGKSLSLDNENVVISSPLLRTQFQSKFWNIKAVTAHAKKRMRELDLQGEVSIFLTNESDLMITTPQLHYSLANKLLSSDQTVQIQDPPFNFNANGIQVDLTSEQYLLSGGIRGEETN
ncbi:MAG: LPS export ABC transporter periplasmic protein LptC [Gammaproteobacteria bacterium]|nr:LPS export ABC transporter periplasmic protein LptC [Gammaproteobacteria bacterium]